MLEDYTDYIQPAPGERLYTKPVELNEIPTVLHASRGRKDRNQDRKITLHRVLEEESEALKISKRNCKMYPDLCVPHPERSRNIDDLDTCS